MRVQDAPDVDVIVPIKVENKVGIATKHDDAQSGKRKFMSIAGRAHRRMHGNFLVGRFQGIDESERDIAPSFGRKMTDGVLDVPTGKGSRTNRFRVHGTPARRACSRRPAK